jgi:hypothetical protein
VYRHVLVTHRCNANAVRPRTIATPAEAASLALGRKRGRANIRRHLTGLQLTLASAFAVGRAAATAFLLGTKPDNGPRTLSFWSRYERDALDPPTRADCSGRQCWHPLYTSTPYPIFQWMDDLQIWRTFSTATPDDPWHDPPYAPH